jgi:adenine phosphoribosyltransferase
MLILRFHDEDEQERNEEKQDERVHMNADKIKAAIRDIPDFPKPGILFKDITPILGNPELFRATTSILAGRCQAAGASRIAAIDARGFFFAGAVCEKLGLGLVPIRKKGKLPYRTFEESYELEYGSATLAIHQDAFERGEKVILIDDLLATGGTAGAAARLIEKAGGKLIEIDFVIELAFLNGRSKLPGRNVFSIVEF